MKHVLLLFIYIAASSFHVPESKYEFTIQPVNVERKPIIKEKLVPKVFHQINSIPKSQWSESDWLAKMLMTEVHTTDSLSIQALYLFAYTALNHAKLLDITLIEALQRPGAFSGVNKSKYKYWNEEPTLLHKQIAEEVFRDSVPEKYKDLYAFCACESSIVSKKTRKWFNKLPLVETITLYNIPITFYNYPYATKE